MVAERIGFARDAARSRALVGPAVGSGVAAIVGGGDRLHRRENTPNDGDDQDHLACALLLACAHGEQHTLDPYVRKALAFLPIVLGAPGFDRRELRWSFDVDGPITLSGALAWVTTVSLRETIGPEHCRWCETNSFDVGARNALRWNDQNGAFLLVNVLGFAVGPSLVMGADLFSAWREGAWKSFFGDALMIAEAAVLASDVNLMLRFAVARERPWATNRSDLEKASPNQTRDRNLSFDSGHTTFMFAVATSAGTIATMRGYKWAPLVWIVGVPLAIATGYMRIASDDHWMTDVLVGAGMGAAFGFAIPYFAHSPVKITPSGIAGTW